MKAPYRTDLKKLIVEVLAQGSDAALPCNLPDQWLRRIAHDINRSRRANREGRHEEYTQALATPALMVLSLISGKNSSGVGETLPSVTTLTDAINKFAIAVAEEIVGRETGIFVRRHTRDDIV